MLSFAAFTPHTPLLLPEVGKENLEKLSATNTALDEIATELYAAKPDVIMVISGHGSAYEDAITIHMDDPYKLDLSKLGGIDVGRQFRPDFLLIDRLQRYLRKADMPASLHAEENLDYGTAVPLLKLTEKLPEIKIVPINTTTGLTAKTHFHFGQALREVIEDSPRRVAVIASGDLSHCLTSDAPAEFNPKGHEFDDKIQEVISSNNAMGLLSIDPRVAKEVSQCGWRPLLVLFGILDTVNIRSSILSYEAPFGVGYLTATFELK